MTEHKLAATFHPGTGPVTQIEQLAQVLDEHVPPSFATCACGETCGTWREWRMHVAAHLADVLSGSGLVADRDALARHLGEGSVDALLEMGLLKDEREVQAAAWDACARYVGEVVEGVPVHPIHANPYRAAEVRR